MEKEEILKKTLFWAENKNYAGYDPYDGLNAQIFPSLINKDSILNILITQTLRRLPINIRPILKIRKERNPMGIALFSLTYKNIYKKRGSKKHKKESERLLGWLLNHKRQSNDYIYWGYNFPWQSRRGFLSKDGPCSVVTYFAGRAIERVGQVDEYGDTLKSIGRFYLEGLNRLVDDEDQLCLSYTPYERVKIVNSNALLASQLLKFGKKIDNNEFIDESKKMISWVISKQEDDGGWYYSPDSHLGKDNFHNGYVIWALLDYLEENNDPDLEGRLISSIKDSLKFYERLFEKDGLPYSSLKQKYPIDIHNCSQGIITFKIAEEHGFHEDEFYEAILNYTIENMRDDDKNYFYYQKHRLWTNKIPYMRWSQAWMCYSISLML